MPCISMFYGIMVYMYNSGKELKIKSSVNVKLSHFFCNSASLSIVPPFFHTLLLLWKSNF